MFVDLQKSFKDRTLGRISISDSSTSNAVVISKKTNNSQFYLFITRANGDIVAEITTNVDYDVRNKIAISWEVDNFKFYVNGFLVHTVTSGETPIDLNAFAFNGSNESLFNFFGEINTVQYYNSSLQNLEIEKLNIGHDNNRFEQELIYYIEKIDITEEQVRLKNHLEYFLSSLKNNTSNGKKLAFIGQEIGREINTIGSKANNSEMQKLVIQMKDELEKIKEQLLNVL